MSALLATANPHHIKAAHRRRRRCATGHRVYANNSPYKFTDPDGRLSEEREKRSEQKRSVTSRLGNGASPVRVNQIASPAAGSSSGSSSTSSGSGSGADVASTSSQMPSPSSSEDSNEAPRACEAPLACPTYGDRYINHLNEYLINVGPYAAALAGGVWPKSWAPATGGRGPLLGSKNPLTSIPRGFGMPGGGSTLVQTGAAGIGLATVAVGFFNVGVFVSAPFYAIPSYCGCDSGGGQ